MLCQILSKASPSLQLRPFPAPHPLPPRIWTLKGHGNEADFLGFLQKLGPHRSLTLPFEPFRIWLRIHGDIRNQKTTPRLTKSGSRRLSDSVSRGVDDSTSRRVWESAFECLKEKLGELESRRLPDSAYQGVANSPTRRVGESPWRVGESVFEFFKI